ncbi:ATP-binding protein [Sphingomonas sp. 2R-10]|uniref:ATP-binding protein n=1 Tax=Sphingomonas sp. 2R-10 TaxID=3045148 RepID=UPI0013DE1EBC|nr:ATP-binding protein [Sphingomonas sp. 2R-10]MDJ0275639.1 ATP-binding protein [Sphingomonas sp. 2R-10]
MPARIALEGDILRTRGDIASDDSDVASALADYQAAFRTYQATGDQRGQAMALLSIGSLYRQGADFAGALRYYGQAIDTYAADPLLLVSMLNNRGNVLTEIGRYRDALADQKRALALAPRLDSPAFTARILGNVARAQRGAGDEDAAWQSIVQGMSIARRANVTAVANQLETLAGRIAVARGDRALGIRLVDRAFAGVDLKKTPLAARDNHRNAYAVYSAAGETRKALAHLEALDRLNEQATQLTTSTKTALMSARFDFQNQELRIARLKQEELRRNIAFERASARFERILFGSIAAAVLVLIVLLVVGVVTLRRSRDAVRRANVDLAATNVALEKALKAKGDFLATTSHEIRTPLNGILGMAQVMLRDDRLAPDMRDRLDIVHDAGIAMRALVDDILDVAKMESGNLCVERVPTDLVATVEDVARPWRRQAQDRGIGFTLDMAEVPRWIEGDPVRLRQILFNLLSNALKFTQDGAVALSVAVSADRLRIAVTDTGIGIAPDRLEDVFESFQQADTSTTRRFGGTGLGLTICRNLVRAMGGDITVVSDEGRGSTFTLDLPLVPVTGEVAAPGVPAGTGGRLVVLERNPIARGMMRTLFAARVAAIDFVDDPATLHERLRRDDVRAVLVDMALLAGSSELPQRALAGLADAVRPGSVPVVVMLRPGDRIDTDAKPLTLLTKPVSATQLISALFVHEDDGAHAVPLVSSAA